MAKPRRLAVLLLDDGELDDVQRILEDVGAEFGRVRGGAIVPDTPPPRRLLISTPRRIQSVRDYDAELDGDEMPVRIVVAEGDSNTLRARLREIGFDYIVRRPVHPEALRLLILRCLYTGDERRRDPRVPVGYEISFRTGLLHRRATLADLSSGGCRLLTSYAVHPEKRIRIQIPAGLGNDAPLALTARVLRRHLDEDHGEQGTYVAALAFEDLGDEERLALGRVIAACRKGPATLGDAPSVTPDPRSEPPDSRLIEKARVSSADPRVEPEPAEPPPPAAAADVEARAAEERIDTPRVEVPEASDPLGFDPTFDFDCDDLQQVDLEVEIRLEEEVGALDPDAETLPELEVDDDFDAGGPSPDLSLPDDVPYDDDEDTSERRHTRRGSFERKVPAFGNRALRVLVGRDLSMQGMRVERFPGLEVGDRLHVALYGDAEEADPLLVWATVSRDDGEDGMALVFDEVGRGIARKLEALVCSLPAVESLHDDECGAMGTVVGEVLET